MALTTIKFLALIRDLQDQYEAVLTNGSTQAVSPASTAPSAGGPIRPLSALIPANAVVSNGPTINGSGGKELILGGTNSQWIQASGGNDTVQGGGGNDTMNGGTGTDTLTFEAYGSVADPYVSGVTASLSAGTYAVNAGGSGLISGFENIQGSTGADVFYGNSTGNKIAGGQGNDTIDGSDGNDDLYGELDDDSLSGGLGADLLDGGVGNDNLNDQAGKNVFRGGSGEDIMVGGLEADDFDGGDGDDDVYDDGGDNRIRMGAGADAVYIDFQEGTRIGNNDINTGGDDDVVYAFSARNKIKTEDGNDLVVAPNGRNNIDTNVGSDTVVAGGDLIQLLPGTTTKPGSKPELSLSLPPELIIAAESYLPTILSAVEKIGSNTGFFSSQALTSTYDTVIAALPGVLAAGNRFLASEPNLPSRISISKYSSDFNVSGGTPPDQTLAIHNEIKTGDDSDVVLALTGRNKIDTDSGSDIVFALSGRNNISTEDSTDLVLALTGKNDIKSDEGSDFIFALSGDVKIDSKEDSDFILVGALIVGGGDYDVRSGSGDDVVLALPASTSTVKIDGNNGDDLLVGSYVAGDRIKGGRGNDVIFSQDGADTIEAGSGNDIIDLSGFNLYGLAQSAMSQGLGDLQPLKDSMLLSAQSDSTGDGYQDLIVFGDEFDQPDGSIDTIYDLDFCDSISGDGDILDLSRTLKDVSGITTDNIEDYVWLGLVDSDGSDLYIDSLGGGASSGNGILLAHLEGVANGDEVTVRVNATLTTCIAAPSIPSYYTVGYYNGSSAGIWLEGEGGEGGIGGIGGYDATVDTLLTEGNGLTSSGGTVTIDGADFASDQVTVELQIATFDAVDVSGFNADDKIVINMDVNASTWMGITGISSGSPTSTNSYFLDHSLIRVTTTQSPNNFTGKFLHFHVPTSAQTTVVAAHAGTFYVSTVTTTSGGIVYTNTYTSVKNDLYSAPVVRGLNLTSADQIQYILPNLSTSSTIVTDPKPAGSITALEHPLA